VYVLHTAFELPYAEIAELLDRSPEDCRQLHHRAAEHVRLGRRRFTADRVAQERLLTNFVTAAREGDLPALARLVAADATAWSDGGGRVKAALNPIVGTARIVRFFAGIRARWRELEPLEVNAHPALLVRRPTLPARGGLPSASTYLLTISAFRPTPETPSGQISDFFLIANPGKLEALGPLLRR
jgi:RNA polymerase sigma-70 factor (ECF subfamily)